MDTLTYYAHIGLMRLGMRFCMVLTMVLMVRDTSSLDLSYRALIMTYILGISMAMDMITYSAHIGMMRLGMRSGMV
eukprot:1835789-Ditylum_brightwellii.AAC.1